jgi:hypothetical protein
MSRDGTWNEQREKFLHRSLQIEVELTEENRKRSFVKNVKIYTRIVRISTTDR